MLYNLYLYTEFLTYLPALLLGRTAYVLANRPLRQRTGPAHEVTMAVWMLYLFCLLRITLNIHRLLEGHLEMAANYNLTPFSTISSMAGSGWDSHAIMNIFGNIAMFLPMGLLPPLLWRGWGFGRTLLLALAFTVAIETIQLFTGRSADVDDVILNTAGGMLGYGCYRLVCLVAPGWAEKCRTRVRVSP